jgi:hypothetical protein
MNLVQSGIQSAQMTLIDLFSCNCVRVRRPIQPKFPILSIERPMVYDLLPSQRQTKFINLNKNES